MTALLKHTTSLTCPVEHDIRANAGWLGHISGLKAEKLLRGNKTPFLYVLREGEYEGDYYITFVGSNLSVSHQPFTITETETGWYYENGGGSPLSPESRLDDILHLIMHCEKDQCQPLNV
jgi:hypothetical protein